MKKMTNPSTIMSAGQTTGPEMPREAPGNDGEPCHLNID